MSRSHICELCHKPSLEALEWEEPQSCPAEVGQPPLFPTPELASGSFLPPFALLIDAYFNSFLFVQSLKLKVYISPLWNICIYEYIEYFRQGVAHTSNSSTQQTGEYEFMSDLGYTVRP